MIKDLNTLTVKSYSLFDKTDDYSHFKKWYNIFPTILFKKKLLKLATTIHNKLSGSKSDPLLDKEVHRINSINRIQLLIALYQAAYNLLENLTKVNEWKKSAGLKETEYKYLKQYTDKIFKYTGYEIKTVADLSMLINEIDRLTEKYAEFFTNNNKSVKGVTFMQIYMGVIAIMNLPFNYEMTMSDFFEAKDVAQEMIKDKNKKIQNNGRH